MGLAHYGQPFFGMISVRDLCLKLPEECAEQNPQTAQRPKVRARREVPP
jgi:hypothetical protein